MRSWLGSIRDTSFRSKSRRRALGSATGGSSSSAANNDDLPPAYSFFPLLHSSNPPPRPHVRPPKYTSSDQDPYGFMSAFDTIFLIDDSGSMIGPSWKETKTALKAIMPVCMTKEANGIDIYFLNHRSGMRGPKGKASGGYYGIDSTSLVEIVFMDARPSGGTTPMGARLQTILQPYLARLSAAGAKNKVKPINIIVITHGRPSDDPQSVIVHHANMLDRLNAQPHQVGIQIFQVGNEDGARKALRKMDHELAKQGIRDMVDAVTRDAKAPDGAMLLSAELILQVILWSIVRRLDRQRSLGS